MATLKVHVKEYREKRGWSQSELAEKVGVRRETIGHLEKGKYNPSLVLALTLAQVLEVPITDLFGLEETVEGEE